MSADRWSICPRCYARVNDEFDATKDLYGKVSREEYEEAVAKAAAMLDKFDNQEQEAYTLREDFYFSLDEYLLTIKYSCHCSVCNLTYDTKEVKDIRK